MLCDVQYLQGITLPLNEVYPSIQGEAEWTGTPSWFVRTQGCPVGCPWCDTKYTWDKREDRRHALTDIVNKREPSTRWADVDADRLLGLLSTVPGIKHVVITGGEPCLHEGLYDMTKVLIQADYSVQLETSGTFEVNVHDNVWVTCSPKIGMPGGRKLLDQPLHRADEIKFPVGRQEDVERLQTLVVPFKRDNALVWLQPISQSAKATALCVDTAMKCGYRVSAQVHKFLNLP